MNHTDGRPKCELIDVKKVINEVERKITSRLEEKGWHTWASSHEISGALTEEYDEFKESVHNNNLNEIEKELLDVAVTAVFGIVSTRKGLDWPKE
jgi:NTP pyrophosphatase (non-canonical NTP hydrolase)